MQSIFKRYEKKFLVSKEQNDAIRSTILHWMKPDRYDKYIVQNLYYDNDNWDIIRSSIEKPLYKEKLRLRCYGVPNKNDRVFLELKKKYKGVVYKRRLIIPWEELLYKSVREIVAADTSQISRELEFYLCSHAVSEKIHISYHREAFVGDEGLRITFDRDVRFRLEHLDYQIPHNPHDGKLILPSEMAVMEVKVQGGMPMWLARALSENEIFPTSYSKYGVCYTHYILNGTKNERQVCLYA